MVSPQNGDTRGGPPPFSDATEFMQTAETPTISAQVFQFKVQKLNHLAQVFQFKFSNLGCPFGEPFETRHP